MRLGFDEARFERISLRLAGEVLARLGLAVHARHSRGGIAGNPRLVGRQATTAGVRLRLRRRGVVGAGPLPRAGARSVRARCLAGRTPDGEHERGEDDSDAWKHDPDARADTRIDQGWSWGPLTPRATKGLVLRGETRDGPLQVLDLRKESGRERRTTLTGRGGGRARWHARSRLPSRPGSYRVRL